MIFFYMKFVEEYFIIIAFLGQCLVFEIYIEKTKA